MARLRMNLEVLFVVLACNNLLFCPKAEGFLEGSAKSQKGCAAGTPININVGNCVGSMKGEKGDKGLPGAKGDMGAKGGKGDKGSAAPSCKCNLQDPKKPSAHMEAGNKGNAVYQNNQVIKDWSASAPNSHIEGGMTYNDGKLTVPIAGRYYIYAQFYYHERGRIYIRVNDKFITMLQPAVGSGSRHGALYSGGVFNLNAGDVITVLATNIHGTVRGYMGPFHSYFGAFLI